MIDLGNYLIILSVPCLISGIVTGVLLMSLFWGCVKL